MKISLTSGYTFNPVGRALDFTGKPDFDLRRLYAVINVSADTLIYAVGKPGRGYKTLTNGVLTLDYDTSGMSVQDVLIVLYEDGDSATNTKLEALRQEVVKLATATGQSTISTTLSSILSTLQSQVDFESAIWTNGTTYYIRRESVNEGSGAYTVTWTDASGTPIVAPTGVKPVASDNAIQLLTSLFDVKTAGTGYSVGDQLSRVVAVNKGTTPPTASSAIWINMTTGAVIAAPDPATVAETDQNVTVRNADLGTQADAAATSDTGTFSLIALVKRGLQNWTSLISAVGADPASPPVLNLGTGIRGWLSTLSAQAKRAFYYPEITTGTALAANAVRTAVNRTNTGLGSRYRAMAQVDVSGATLDIYGSDDNFATRQFRIVTVALTAGTLGQVEAPALFANMRAQITNGANAATIAVLTTGFTEV